MALALIATLALSHCLHVENGPFNMRGRFVDLAPEDMEWAMPNRGARMTLTLSKADMPSVPAQWSVKDPKWKSAANLKGTVSYAGGTLKGQFGFRNTSGRNLAGMRLDVRAATETYRGKDKDGKEVELTRAMPIKEDSPLLLGDMLEGVEANPLAISASGLTWKPETVKVDVEVQLSGYTHMRSLYSDHANSFLAFDTKGRLLLGSGQQAAIYRCNLEQGSLEVLASVPDCKVKVAVNPVDNTIACCYINAHEFHLLTAGGSEKGTLNQNDDVSGMSGWPSDVAYDGKGRIYAMFGSTIAQMAGERPAFVLSGALGFTFQGYPHFAVADDGTLFVGSESNVFRFADGGKNPKKIVQGPDWKPGRCSGINAITFDNRSRTLWVASTTDNEFVGRVECFDENGRYICSLGRAGDAPNEAGESYPSQCPFPMSIALAPNGDLYVANYDQSTAVQEFSPIGN